MKMMLNAENKMYIVVHCEREINLLLPCGIEKKNLLEINYVTMKLFLVQLLICKTKMCTQSQEKERRREILTKQLGRERADEIRKGSTKGRNESVRRMNEKKKQHRERETTVTTKCNKSIENEFKNERKNMVDVS